MPAFNDKSLEQYRVRFTHKQKTAVSHRIWTIFAAVSCRILRTACGIWQNFPQKNCGP